MEEHYKRKIFDENVVKILKENLSQEELVRFSKYVNKLPLSTINNTFKESILERYIINN